jgi:hypothetical protein
MNWPLLLSSSVLAFAAGRGVFAQDVGSLTAQSQFVFNGSVIRVGAATLREITPDAHTAIVRVNEVLRAPPISTSYLGREITVQFAAAPPGLDEPRVFFTAAWIFGDSVAVREVGRLPDSAILRTALARALADQPGALVQGRLGGSELVLVGRVTATRPAPDKVRRGAPGEHDPDWWEAELQVQSVEKGKGRVAGKSFVVLFPASSDIVWQQSPKFRASQEGVWILREERAKGRPTFGYYMALDPLDFQPPDQIELIRRFLK